MHAVDWLAFGPLLRRPQRLHSATALGDYAGVMTDEQLDAAERERRLTAELEAVQRELRDPFPPSTEPRDISNPVRPKLLRRDERARLHGERDAIRAQLDKLRHGMDVGENEGEARA